jgi:hypothetical protein
MTGTRSRWEILTMCREPSGTDGSTLAGAVRTLAVDVKRLRSHGGAPAHEVAALAGRIHRLKSQTRALPMTPLAKWLDNLERELYDN